MMLGELGKQVVLISKKAFEKIKFINYDIVSNNIYYEKRKARDVEARVAFKEELKNDDVNGIYIRDIIREGIKNDDQRVR